MNDPDWIEYRHRARRRSSALMALIIAPVILVIVAIRVVGPQDYPPGDIRHEPAFWIVFWVAVFVLIGLLVVGSIRYLAKSDVR
jgi:hypothetical protein